MKAWQMNYDQFYAEQRFRAAMIEAAQAQATQLRERTERIEIPYNVHLERGARVRDE